MPREPARQTSPPRSPSRVRFPVALDIPSLIDAYMETSETELSREEVVTVLDNWRAALHANGESDVELAAPFQRHFTVRGTGVPANFCLAIAGDEVKVFKFNPRNGDHPFDCRRGQIRGHVADWPMKSVKVTSVDAGKHQLNSVLEVDADGKGPTEIPCRAPRLARNPATAVMLSALGG